MRTFGLIGFPLSHSFSKKFFTEKFEKEKIPDCIYELFPMEKVELVLSLLADNESLCGFNITIPHKVSIIPYLDQVDIAAAEIGAVNCVRVSRVDGKWSLKGFNTDAYGFAESLKPLLKSNHRKALIFGNGGAAKAVKYVLQTLEIPFQVVSRKGGVNEISYQEVTPAVLQGHQLLINTTPLGMSPHTDTAPAIPYDALGEGHLAYDLVYNPLETLFLSKAKTQGATVKNGLEMLYLQAERSWEIWND